MKAPRRGRARQLLRKCGDVNERSNGRRVVPPFYWTCSQSALKPAVQCVASIACTNSEEIHAYFWLSGTCSMHRPFVLAKALLARLCYYRVRAIQKERMNETVRRGLGVKTLRGMGEHDNEFLKSLIKECWATATTTSANSWILTKRGPWWASG